MSLFLSQPTLLSPLLFRACHFCFLCPPSIILQPIPPWLPSATPLNYVFFFFSVYSSSWLPPFDSQPCLTVALSWTCTLLPSGSFSLHKAGPFMSRGLTLHNVCFVLGVQSQTETGAGVFLVALACLHQASHCSVCLRVQPCHSRLSPPAANPADFQTEPETTKQESHGRSSKGCHLLREESRSEEKARLPTYPVLRQQALC